MTGLVDMLVALLVVVGAAFALLGSVALVRFPDCYMRLHGPGIATTLGLGCLLTASLLHFGVRGAMPWAEVLAAALLALNGPVAAQLLARVARHRRIAPWRGDDRP